MEYILYSSTMYIVLLYLGNLGNLTTPYKRALAHWWLWSLDTGKYILLTALLESFFQNPFKGFAALN